MAEQEAQTKARAALTRFWGSTIVTYLVAGAAVWARTLVPAPWGAILGWSALALGAVAFARTGAALGDMAGTSYIWRRNLMRAIPTMHLNPELAADPKVLAVTVGAATWMVGKLQRNLVLAVVGLAALLIAGYVLLPSWDLRAVIFVSACISFCLSCYYAFLNPDAKKVLAGFIDVANVGSTSNQEL